MGALTVRLDGTMFGINDIFVEKKNNQFVLSKFALFIEPRFHWDFISLLVKVFAAAARKEE